MLLLLQSSPAQQQALDAELASLENPSSPNYRQWLSPTAFAQSYANNASDAAAVVDWLASHGFAVATLPAGLGWVEFSGTAAQVEQAFGAQIHLFSVEGNTRAALTGGIRIPAALMPVIGGLVSLDGALAAPALTAPQPLGVSVADLAGLTLPAGAAALTPLLAGQLLDLAPLAAEGVNGAGQTIAVVSRSNVNRGDVAAFRAAFALPASPLQMLANGAGPGLTDDQAQATLSASWAGAAAPGAKILLVPAATTAATDGVDLSLAGIIDQNLANVVAVGYSSCEAALSPAHQAFYAALYRQAAAEGITVVAAAGDGGAAACTPAGATALVKTGRAVNALASTPWDLAVGVAGYGAGGVSAGVSELTAWSPSNSSEPVYASGGGASALYPKTAWQAYAAATVKGKPAASHRLLPDLALPTALDSSANPGLAYCLSSASTSSNATSGCTLVRSGGSGVATAWFAGMVALINQQNGVQGNLGPSLYATSRIGGVFNDVTQGAAMLACLPGSPDCDATGEIGYSASAGYDLTTGLGVPDVRKLVTEWAKPMVTSTPPAVTLAIAPAQTNNTYNPSAIVAITATVKDSTGAGIPAGIVALYDSSNYNELTPYIALTSTGSVSTGSTATFSLELSSFSGYPTGSDLVSYNLGAYYYDTTRIYPNANPDYLLSVTSEKSPAVLAITPSTVSPGLGSNIAVTVAAGVAASGPPAGSAPPSGAVTLAVNGTALNPVTLTTTAGVTSAVFTVPIAAKSNSLVASYAGDINYTGATTNPYVLSASKVATNVVLTSSTATAGPGQTVVLYATVAAAATPPPGDEQNPSGTVVFYNGASYVGSAMLTAEPGSNSSLATLSTQSLAGGSAGLTAVYAGDAVFGGATSNLLGVLVQGFTLTASPNNPPTNLNLTQGATGAESFLVTSVGGYTGAVQVICTVPAQDDMSCQVSPQQVMPTATVTFTVQTYATGGPAYAALGRPLLPGRRGPQAAGDAMLAALVFFLLPLGRRARTLLREGPRRLVVLLLLLAGLLGTGMGCSGTTASMASNSGTPLGVATLEVTATAYVNNAVAAQNIYFTVNVQPQ